jgi:hypothetical protein
LQRAYLSAHRQASADILRAKTARQFSLEQAEKQKRMQEATERAVAESAQLARIEPAKQTETTSEEKPTDERIGTALLDEPIQRAREAEAVTGLAAQACERDKATLAQFTTPDQSHAIERLLANSTCRALPAVAVNASEALAAGGIAEQDARLEDNLQRAHLLASRQSIADILQRETARQVFQEQAEEQKRAQEAAEEADAERAQLAWIEAAKQTEAGAERKSADERIGTALLEEQGQTARAAEAATRLAARACQRDEASLAQLTTSDQSHAIEQLRTRSHCSALPVAASKALKAIAMRSIAIARQENSKRVAEARVNERASNNRARARVAAARRGCVTPRLLSRGPTKQPIINIWPAAISENPVISCSEQAYFE